MQNILTLRLALTFESALVWVMMLDKRAFRDFSLSFVLVRSIELYFPSGSGGTKASEHPWVLVIRIFFVNHSLNAQSCPGLCLAETEIKGISSVCICILQGDEWCPKHQFETVGKKKKSCWKLIALQQRHFLVFYMFKSLIKTSLFSTFRVVCKEKN